MCVRCAARVCAVTVLLCLVLCTDQHPSVKENQYMTELYVAVGSDMDVPCKGEGGEGAQWRLNGLALDAGPILSIRNVTLDDGGNYTCHNRHGALMQLLSLQPGYPPSPPKVKCWSRSYPFTARCSWSEGPEPLLPTRYTATYGTGRCYATGQCEFQLLQHCVPIPGLRNQCLLKHVELFNLETHINVTATNPLGSISTLFSFIMEDIVKPDPPVRVKVTPNSQRQLYVQWAPPPTWPNPTLFPLKYKVRYYEGNARVARELGPYESQSMLLKTLRSGRTYFVQISAQDQLVGQRSDWSQPVSATVLSH